MNQVHEFEVKMTCGSCSGAVEKVLNKFKGKGIDDFDVSLTDQKVKVTSTMSSEEILNIIKKTGKETTYVSST